MGDETGNPMNLDLNLGPLPTAAEAMAERAVSLEEFIGSVNEIRDGLRQREIQQRRRSQRQERIREHLSRLGRLEIADHLQESIRVRQLRESIRHQSMVSSATARVVASQLMVNPVIDPSSSFHLGEASVTPIERDAEPLKVTENNNEINVGNEELGEKGKESKSTDDDKESFFDCNICLDLAKDPVVTCCGHLFCWPCVYQWLIHSVANECPVCKGEVTMKNLTPIYGRGNSPCEPEQEPPVPKIPDRPHAQRVESVRQTILRNSVSVSMDELVRRLSESRGIVWRDHTGGTGIVWREQVASGADMTVSRDPASDRMVSFVLGRNREQQPPPLDDRDSVSSIAAVIQSGSQTIDTVLEIDSNVSISTSTSRRRRNGNEASRASDVDSGDSRPHRRRRIN